MEPVIQTGQLYNEKSIIWIHVIVLVSHVGFLLTVVAFFWCFAPLQMFRNTFNE